MKNDSNAADFSDFANDTRHKKNDENRKKTLANLYVQRFGRSVGVFG